MTRALLIVDVQNDFCEPDGALAVKGSSEIFSVINALKDPKNKLYDLVILTCDRHPVNHISFASIHPGSSPFSSIVLDGSVVDLWPDHCVAGTAGAEFHPELEISESDIVVPKGVLEHIESYSGFGSEKEKTGV